MIRVLHVVPVGEKWGVRQEGAAFPRHVTSSEAGAVSVGSSMADQIGGKLVVHDRAGRVVRS